MKYLLQGHTFYNMMKQNACFKNDGSSCIDLLIKNSKFSFMKKNSFDHHHMIYTILETKFEKFEPKKSIQAMSNNLIMTTLNWISVITYLL